MSTPPSPPTDDEGDEQNEEDPDSPFHVTSSGDEVRKKRQRLNQDEEDTSATSARSTTRAGKDLKPGGLGLRGKLIFLVLGAQLFSALFMFFYSTYATKNALEQEIYRSGKQLITVLSLLDVDYLEEDKFGAVTNEITRDVGSGGELGRLVSSVPDRKDRKKLRSKLKEGIKKYVDRLMDQKKASHQPFLAPLQGKFAIRAISIESWKSESETFEAIFTVPSGGVTMTKAPEEIREDKQHDITISRARLKEAEDSVPVRVFSKITEPDDPSKQMRIRVYLDAGKVEAAAGRMQMTLFGLALLSILIGGVAGWIFSGTIISPIQQLLEDIQTVSTGDLEHRTKSQTDDEIGVIARTFDRMTRSLKEAQERELEAKALEHELNIAMEVQGKLLPQWKPQIEDWDMDAYYKPSKEVGGDYYDFIEIDEDRIGMIVADVSGKGIPGSMVMTMTRAMLRMEASRHKNTEDTLKRVNRMLAKDIRRGMFVTCMYVILNKKSQQLLVSSAGHNPLVLWREEEQQVKTVNPNGIALGFDEGPVFDRSIEERILKMKPGDRFTLYTDGVVEAMSPEEEEFGDQRFYELCGRLADRESNQFTNIVVQQIDNHQGDAPQHDDITILTARYSGPEAE